MEQKLLMSSSELHIQLQRTHDHLLISTGYHLIDLAVHQIGRSIINDLCLFVIIQSFCDAYTQIKWTILISSSVFSIVPLFTSTLEYACLKLSEDC